MHIYKIIPKEGALDQNFTEIFSAFYFINQSIKPIFVNLVRQINEEIYNEGFHLHHQFPSSLY